MAATRAQLVTSLRGREEIAGLPNGVITREVRIGASLGARLYLPRDAARPLATLVHLHGGGWVAGGVETHDPFCRLLSEAASLCVLSVEYRLAPEHPYPAAVDDARAAFAWAVEHANEWDGDPRRVALGGDSAGANVAAVVVNRMVELGDAAQMAAQVLLFPITDHSSQPHTSYSEEGCGFDAEFMHWIWRQYAPDVSPADPGISPLRGTLSASLPPTFVATAEYDILRDEGVAYTEKLRAAGVDVTHLHGADMHHNFFVNPATVSRFPQCEEALAALAAWMRRTLGTTPA